MTQNSTKSRILAVASSTGWKADPDNDDAVIFTRGRRYLRVRFSVRGGVVEAATQSRTFDGAGKADRVIAELGK